MNLHQGKDMDHPDTILWRGILLPGHEACRVFFKGTQWHLEGTAVSLYERRACLLSYEIVCDRTWHTLSATVNGWLDEMSVNIQLRTNPNQHWWLNEAEVPGVTGCIDLDLNFSPTTNLIPIRRLKLNVGEKADLTAAWLKFPDFNLEPLPQRYTRLEEKVYRYESGGGRFVADLRVNRTGFVVDYPGIWEAEVKSED